MSRVNGDAPDRLPAITDALSVLLEQEEQAVVTAQAALDEAKARRVKIQRALDALEGTPKTTRPSRPKKKQQGWAVSEAKVELIRGLIVGRAEPVSTAELADESGVTKDTVRKALMTLRERDVIRLSGTRPGRGGGTKLYLSMPESTDAS